MNIFFRFVFWFIFFTYLYIVPLFSSAITRGRVPSTSPKNSASSSKESSSPPFKFIVNSDLHISNGAKITKEEIEQEKMKKLQSEKIKELCGKGDIGLIILAGDMCTLGKKEIFDSFCNYFINSDSIKGFGRLPYLKGTPSERISAVPILMCNGNHDGYGGNVPIGFIRKQYGGLKYVKFINGIYFISCGLHPRKSRAAWKNTFAWLKRQLNKIGKTDPIVIFFHYNIVGLYSDWWTKTEKNMLFDIIKDYPNVLHIFTGHYHASFSHLWRGKIPTSCVGGSFFVIANFVKNSIQDGGYNYKLTVEFMNAGGKTETWENRLKPKFKERGKE